MGEGRRIVWLCRGFDDIFLLSILLRFSSFIVDFVGVVILYSFKIDIILIKYVFILSDPL